MQYSNETYPIRALFNVDCPETCITRIVTDVTSLDRDHVPQVHDYWYSDRLKDVLNYLADPRSPRSEALYISGSTGNGKTSLIVESAARLNWPCISINASSDMKPEDLIGCYRSGRDGDEFVEGPLLKAARRGYIFVLNGVDQVSPDVVAVLKDAVEQQMINICNDTEVIRVNRLFRLVITGSACEVEPGQIGENNLLEICRICKIMQPAEKEFKSIIGLKFPDLFPAELQIISESLAAFQKIGKHLVNIRLALKWAGLYRQSRNGSDNPFHKALDRAVLFRMAEPDREVWYKALDKILVDKGIKKP